MHARTWLMAAALLAASLAGTPAAAQAAFETQVRAYLENGMGAHAALGYRRDQSNADIVVPLQLERPYLWSVYLREGITYRVYGACDNDCSDLDMEIYGADGHLADRDVATDDVPYVQVTPRQTGRHYVRIWLYQCSTAPCYAGARVVEGGTPVDRPAQEPRQ
jgi:hypothetical protein